MLFLFENTDEIYMNVDLDIVYDINTWLSIYLFTGFEPFVKKLSSVSDYPTLSTV